MFKFDPKRLNTKKKLDYSKFGNVYPYQKHPDDTKWAVRCHHPKDFQEIQQVLQTIILCSNLDHPSILPLRGYYLKEDEIEGWRVFIKTPRMEKTLGEFIHAHAKSEKGHLPKEAIIRCFHALVSALDYLKAKRIPHKAIRPSNILIDSHNDIKLVGIGFSELENTSLDAIRESEPYLAPELCKQDKASKREDFYKADVWSLGIVITELCLLKPKQITAGLSVQQKEEIVKRNLAEVAHYYGEELANLLFQDLLCIDPNKRKTFSSICSTLEEKFGSVLINHSSIGSLREINEEEKSGKEASESTAFHQRRRRGVLVISENKKQVGVQNDKKEENKPSVEPKKTALGELQTKWKGIFEFDPNEITKVAAQKINNSEICQVVDQQITEMINDLTKMIKEYTNSEIKTLALNLVSCEKVTNQSLAQIGASFSKELNGLEELALNFSNSKIITSVGLIQLGYDIKQSLKSLKKLTLDFRDCLCISSTSKDGIRELLGFIPNLSIL